MCTEMDVKHANESFARVVAKGFDAQAVVNWSQSYQNKDAVMRVLALRLGVALAQLELLGGAKQ